MGANLTLIDLGFMTDKIKVNNNKPEIIKSVVGTEVKMRFNELSMSDKEERPRRIICDMDGQRYFVSDLAISQSETVYHSLKPDRFDTIATKVLINTSFAMGLGKGFHETYLVSGLPTDHFDQYKQNLSDLFTTGNFIHEYNSVIDDSLIRGSVRIIETSFIPQPFGALMNEILDEKGAVVDKSLASQCIAIVDIGFGTTDVYVVSALDPVERLSFSTSTAVNTICKLIASKLSQKPYELDLPLHKVEQIVITKKYRKGSNLYNMSSLVDWARESVAQQLVSELYNHWGANPDIDIVVPAGGGGVLLYEDMRDEFESVRLAKNGQLSIVEGYYKWGKRRWKGVC